MTIFCRIAVPKLCDKHESTIDRVVSDSRSVPPDAETLVYDNNSRDESKLVASQAGMIVRTGRLQGKGSFGQFQCFRSRCAADRTCGNSEERFSRRDEV